MSLAPRAALLLSLTLCAPGCALYAALDDSDVEVDQAPAFDLGDDMSPDQTTDMPPSTEVYDDLAKCLAAGCEAGGANLCAQRGDNRYDCRSPEQIHACAQSVSANAPISNARLLSGLEQGGGVTAVLQGDEAQILIGRFLPGSAPERRSSQLIGQRILAVTPAREAGEVNVFFANNDGGASLQRLDLKPSIPAPVGTNTPLNLGMGPVKLCDPNLPFLAQPYPYGLGNPPELRAAALLCVQQNGMQNWLLAGFIQQENPSALLSTYGTMPNLAPHYSATLTELSAAQAQARVYVVRDRPTAGGQRGYELFPYSFDLAQPNNAQPQMAANSPVLSVPGVYPSINPQADCKANDFLGAQPPIPWLATLANGKFVQAILADDDAGYAIFGQLPTGMTNVTYFCEKTGRYRLRSVAHNPDKGAAILLERGENEKTISLAGFGAPFASGSEVFGHERVDLLRPVAGKFTNLRGGQVFHLGERIKLVGTREAGGTLQLFMLETNDHARPVCAQPPSAP